MGGWLEKRNHIVFRIDLLFTCLTISHFMPFILLVTPMVAGFSLKRQERDNFNHLKDCSKEVAVQVTKQLKIE